MNLRFASMVAAVLLALALGNEMSVNTITGQETAESTKKAASTSATKKPRGRLPAYYGQVGLSGEQRDRIYGIQATYRTQIDELQKQIDSLKEKEVSEIVAVLTPEQKKKAAEARRSKRKSS